MNILQPTISEFENIYYVGTYVGILHDILVLSDERIKDDMGYIVDLSKVNLDGETIKIGESEPNLVAFINLK